MSRGEGTKHCCWGLCNSDSRYRDRMSEGTFFIPFPKPGRVRDNMTQLERERAKLKTEKAKRWQYLCGRADFHSVDQIKGSTYICSLHFAGGKGPTSENDEPILPTFSNVQLPRRKQRGERRGPAERLGPPKRGRKRLLTRDGVFPADVQQMVLIREEECRPDVDQQEPKPFTIKEEEEEKPCTSLGGEQLSVKEETDNTRLSFIEVSLKSEEDEEKPLFPQLHQDKVEDSDLPTSRSADQITAAADGEGGGAETRNLVLYSYDSNSSETEASEDYEDDKERNNCSHLNHFSEFEPQTEDCEDRKDSMASESVVNTVSECGKQIICNFSLQRRVKNYNSRSSSCSIDDKCVKKCVGCNNPVPLSCDDCGRRFMSKANLNRHSRSHIGDNPFSCDDCGQNFSQRTRFNTHMRIHTGGKPFSCHVCGQEFSHKTTLKTHMLIHTGQKLFACSLCGHRFSHNTTLKAHMRIHTGQKPFSCYICGQRFSRKTN